MMPNLKITPLVSKDNSYILVFAQNVSEWTMKKHNFDKTGFITYLM